jgi:phosphoadenosine phosphosulfate reductase
VITGIRAEESVSRSERLSFEKNYRRDDSWFLHPIIGWASDEIWHYIRINDIPYCKLYDMGWKRIGCLFCPNATPAEKAMHARKYPGYEKAFRRAFNALHMNRTFRGMDSVSRWKDGDEMFDWWIA